MSKVFTLAEVAQHNTKNDCWLIIDGKVYDVTKFMDDHPGGDDVLVTATGRDATNDFEDVGHSTTARAMLDEYYVGDMDSSSAPAKVIPKSTQTNSQNVQGASSGFIVKLLQFLVPLIILVAAVGVRYYTK